MSDGSPVSQRQEMQKHLKELDDFVGSRVWRGFVTARQQEVKDTEQAILMNDPITREDEIEGYKMRGELRCLTEMISTFEDARQSLKVRIEEMLEQENKSADNTKQ